MLEGIVRNVRNDRNFLIVKTENGSTHLCHFSDIKGRRYPMKGDEVIFDIIPNDPKQKIAFLSFIDDTPNLMEYHGVIKNTVPDGNYGFIESSRYERDKQQRDNYFKFHECEIQYPQIGQKVVFRRKMTSRGAEACDIRLARD